MPTEEEIAYATSLSPEDLMDAMSESMIETATGYTVELDGIAEDGSLSPFLILGLI